MKIKTILMLLCILAMQPILAQSSLSSSEIKNIRKAYVNVPIGTVLAFAGPQNVFDDLLSENFMVCDGRELERNQYKKLHYVIGNVWGGAGTVTKFNIPKLQGYFLRGADPKGEIDPDVEVRVNLDGDSRNGVGGYQRDEFLKHKHERENRFYVTEQLGRDGAIDASSIASPYDRDIDHSGIETGGNETRPKNASVLFIIRVK
ncbi:MAG: tail fiber protein [Cyclobacteriaceae bacterium]